MIIEYVSTAHAGHSTDEGLTWCCLRCGRTLPAERFIGQRCGGPSRFIVPSWDGPYRETP